jgi:hypothetical protein
VLNRQSLQSDMRKTFVIFFSLLYLVMASGFTSYSHICKGVTHETSLFSSADANSDQPCPTCVSKNKAQKVKKKGCCKHEAKVTKLKDTGVKKASSQAFSFESFGEVILHRFFGAVFDPAIIAETGTVYSSPSDVPIRRTPLYIFHCVYRI